jgi:hypothetical protein
MSLVKEKSDIELKKKREDLIKYINAIDAEMTLRKKNKSIKEKTKGSFIDSLLSKKPEKSRNLINQNVRENVKLLLDQPKFVLLKNNYKIFSPKMVLNLKVVKKKRI